MSLQIENLELETLGMTTKDGVAYLRIDHPPVNLLDEKLVPEIRQVVASLRSRDDIRVLVTESADPEFFAAHVDFGFMDAPERFMGLADPDEDPGLNPMQSLHRQIRSLPQITIAKLRGRLRGGGAELAAAHDMRFAAAGETWISQVESRLGIFPGGGGTQLLTPLVGRARALEIVLGGELFDSEVAERYGWVNRSVPPAALDDFVASLAGRIAAMPAGAANAAREAVDAAALGDTAGLLDGLRAEGAALAAVYPAPEEVVARVRDAVAGGIQERDSELDLESALDRVG